jgi:hypothetical protein
MTRETVIERYLVDRVRLAGGQSCKFTVPGEAGHPDRLVQLPATPTRGASTWLVEVKRPGQKPRPLQDVRLARWRAAGANVAVVSTRDEVDALVDSCGVDEGVRS